MGPDRNRWLADRVPCPCTKCKLGIPRLRRVCLAHVEDWGLWDDPRKRARLETTDPRALAAFDVSPHWSAYSGPAQRRVERMRQEASIGRDTPPPVGSSHHVSAPAHVEIEDTMLHEMVEDLLLREAQDVCEDDCACEATAQRTEESLLGAARAPLFDGSAYSTLRASLEILNLQAMFGWSSSSVDALLRLLGKMLPVPNKLPEDRRGARKLVTSLGMDYDRIEACVNDCVLFRKEYASLDSCPLCGEARYKEGMQSATVPRKVLRHFPLIPRIQHMFRSKGSSELLTWHALNRSTDGIMRVPADSPAWKHVEETWPEFRHEPRSLRLGLATDGVNPFGVRSTSWSTWPVVIVNYNLPPWETTKKGNILLSLLIPGKHKVKNMDVYLEPLVEELQELWRGVDVMDGSKPARERQATIKAILLWTMHDYPGLGEISGLSTSGHCACPICGPSLVTERPSLLGKVIYPNNHRFLPSSHSKYLPPSNDMDPIQWNMANWAKYWEDHYAQSPPPHGPPRGMSRLSILLTLPYWPKLKIHHLLDPMHVFKNVGQAIWDHVTGKKDSLGAREDMRSIRRLPASAAPRMGPRGKIVLPKAPWIMARADLERMKQVIASIRTPTGYMRSLKGAFTKTKKGGSTQLYGLKSHDWHKMLQFVLPISISGFGNAKVKSAIFKVGEVVRFVSSKEIEISAIPAARLLAVEAVCAIEDAFPRSILVSQVHILLHLIDEVAICGVVHSRWMFFLERFLKSLKDFVRLRAQPEASMAEGWIVQEAFVYVSQYLYTIDPTLPRLWTEEEDPKMHTNVPSGKGALFVMDREFQAIVNNHILLNAPAMRKWVDMYLEARDAREREREAWKRTHGGRRAGPFPNHLIKFPTLINVEWIHNAMTKAKAQGEQIREQEWEYARGCLPKALTFNSIWSQGRHFRTRKIDESRTTNDCGIMGNFDTQNEEVRYCGTIERIMKVDFRTFQSYLFDCRWFAGVVRRHESGLYMVDSTQFHRGSTDTLVHPSSCEQVFYVPCIYQTRMWYVIPVTPRGRTIFAEAHAEDVLDPAPSFGDQDAEEDAVEVDEMEASPLSNHSCDEEDEEEDAESMGNASDDESIHLFVDLATMGFDMDSSACRDLLADENLI